MSRQQRSSPGAPRSASLGQRHSVVAVSGWGHGVQVLKGRQRGGQEPEASEQRDTAVTRPLSHCLVLERSILGRRSFPTELGPCPKQEG